MSTVLNTYYGHVYSHDHFRAGQVPMHRYSVKAEDAKLFTFGGLGTSTPVYAIQPTHEHSLIFNVFIAFCQ